MKNLKAPFLVIALFLLNVLVVSAETSSHPPSPTAQNANTTTAADCEDPSLPSCNPEAGFPINQNIVFLVISGLALGIAVIYKNQIKKASI
ncbi:MAG: hypothetical protein J7574_00710 [Flavobacterium sp.]|uniref:hypothetical protein n=1 Tax=Flavobacterium sp. TaxID=239 RepID=UPI001B2A682B|nr:hypothetical protein [Flavobacterium sp.]MBO9582657.1 hypothetical protein [Flavobacterium sp.]